MSMDASRVAIASMRSRRSFSDASVINFASASASSSSSSSAGAVFSSDSPSSPSFDDDARRMLWMLSGRTHQVHTSVVGCHADGDAIRFELVTVTTDVTFTALTESQIDWYLSIFLDTKIVWL